MVALTMEAIPSTAMFTNLRSILSSGDWDSLRRQVYRKADYCCEICGGKGPTYPVACHEVWSYDLESGIQTLERCIALCPACHEVKHIGLATQRGRQKIAIAHAMKINKWNREQFDDYAWDYIAEYEELCEISWALSLEGIRQYGLSPEDYEDAIPSPTERKAEAERQFKQIKEQENE